MPSRRRFLATAALLLAAAPTHTAHADGLRVVTTIPDLKDITERIGGERVQVDSIARGTENIHTVALRPSALIQVSRADVFVQMGLSLEHAFVPGLLETARNARIQPGRPGFVNCSEGWEPLDVPGAISRGRAADLHPMGNPHFNLAPSGGRHIADRILAGLARADPGSRGYFEERHRALLEELEAAERRWAEIARERLAGRRVATYHSEFTYFARETGLEIAATIEPKPGVPPTPKDLARTVATMREEEIGVILTAGWSNGSQTRFVAEKTGAEILELPVMVQVGREPDTWIEMMDALFARLSTALER